MAGCTCQRSVSSAFSMCYARRQQAFMAGWRVLQLPLGVRLTLGSHLLSVGQYYYWQYW